MYLEYYGLSGMPFSLLPDSSFLYLSARHRRALHVLEYGLETQAGFVVLTGDVGSGKTTLLRRYVKSAGPDTLIGLISNPSARLGSLFEWVARAFDLEAEGRSDAALYHAFVEFLLDAFAAGRRVVLVIDEAQNLDATQLEELRMLSNINNEKDMLLQIVLIGQPELQETLAHPSMRQFVQRIAVHCHLGPLTPFETAAYIHHRLKIVGGAPALFDAAACAAVHYFAMGVPRLINLLCDQALVYAFSDDRPMVSAESVAEVVQDRSDAGLSAFRPLPAHWSPVLLQVTIREILAEIEDGDPIKEPPDAAPSAS